MMMKKIVALVMSGVIFMAVPVNAAEEDRVLHGAAESIYEDPYHHVVYDNSGYIVKYTNDLSRIKNKKAKKITPKDLDMTITYDDDGTVYRADEIKIKVKKTKLGLAVKVTRLGVGKAKKRMKWLWFYIPVEYLK